MRGPRFYLAHRLDRSAVGAVVTLPDAVAHHATRVLRLGAGADVTLFDGDGGEFSATLVAVDKARTLARLDRFDPIERELPFTITLVQSVLASDAMDYAVRKAVELGATALEPVMAARSQSMGMEKQEKRRAHWQAIAVAACEQCGRNRIAAVTVPLPLVRWWEARGEAAELVVVLGPGATDSLASLAARTVPRYVLVGPEGGWTDDEIEAARSRGALFAHLGPRVLRAETAGLAALATIAAVQ